MIFSALISSVDRNTEVWLSYSSSGFHVEGDLTVVSKTNTMANIVDLISIRYISPF